MDTTAPAQPATSSVGTAVGYAREIKAQLREGREAEVGALLAEGLAKFPGHPLLLLRRAEAAADIGLALADAETAASHPRLPEAYRAEAFVTLARRRLDAGRVSEANDAATRAVAVDPRRPSSLLMLSETLDAAGRVPEAIAVVERAIAAAPSKAPPHLQLGRLLLATQDHVALTQAMKQALEHLGERSDLRALLAQALFARGRQKAGIKWAWQAVNLAPDTAGPFNLLLQFLIATGEFDEAARLADRQLLAGRPVPSLELLVQLSLRTRDRDQAGRLFAPVLAAPPMRSLGRALEAHGAKRPPLSSQPAPRRTLVPGHTPSAWLRGLFAGTGHSAERRIGRIPETETIESMTAQNVELCVFKTGFCVLDAAGHPFPAAEPYLFDVTLQAAATLPERGRIDGLAFASHGSLTHNYCHWLTDVLPLLLLGADAADGVPVGMGVPQARSFQGESMAMAAFDPTRVYCLEPGRYRIGTLRMVLAGSALPRRTFHGGNPAYFDVMRRWIPPPQPRGRRIFLVRPIGLGRTLEPFAEVLALAQEFGFEAIDAGSLPVPQQAALLGEASHVMAPHGAALTNLMFCAPGTRVLEVFGPHYGTAAFAMLAELSGLDYRRLISTVPTPPATRRRAINKQNIEIELGALREALAALVT